MTVRTRLRDFGRSTLQGVRHVGNGAKRTAIRVGTSLSGFYGQVRAHAREHTLAADPDSQENSAAESQPEWGPGTSLNSSTSVEESSIPGKSHQDFVNQMLRRTQGILYAMVEGNFTHDKLHLRLGPAVEDIKTFVKERRLPRDFQNPANALKDAFEKGDGKAMERALLDLCIEVYRVKNGIDESNLEKVLRYHGDDIRPEKLLLKRYNERKNSSPI